MVTFIGGRLALKKSKGTTDASTGKATSEADRTKPEINIKLGFDTKAPGA